MLELGLNLKKCIRFCERSEKNLMHFFEFKADSNIGCALLFYTLLPLSEGLVTPPFGVEKLSPRLKFFDNMFSCITAGV